MLAFYNVFEIDEDVNKLGIEIKILRKMEEALLLIDG